MKKFLLFVLPPALVALLFVSCASLQPAGQQPTVPLTKAQLEKMASRAKQPQLFGIIVYPSETGPTFGGAMRTRENEVASLNFPAGDPTRAPLIPIGLSSLGMQNALLDTSAQQSWTTLEAMRTLRIELLLAPTLLASKPNHVFDTYGGLLGTAGHLRIGDDIVMDNVLFQVRAVGGPLGPLARGLDGANVQAVLGQDFMKALNHVVINFPSRYAVLSTSLDCRLGETNLLATVPMLLTNGTIAVQGIVDGTPATIGLDTGGDYAIALTPGKTPGRIQQVSLGDLVLRDQPATPGPDLGLGPITNPRIGRLALSRFKITLDFRHRLIHFERP